ncbi:8774_t:CDS:2, partial [Gigaspora rosea]
MKESTVDTKDETSSTNARETMIKLLNSIQGTMSNNNCDSNCIASLIIGSIIIIILLGGTILFCIKYIKSGKFSDHLKSIKSSLSGSNSPKSDTQLLSGRPQLHSINTQLSIGEEPILNSPDSLYWSGRNQETTTDNFNAAEQFSLIHPPQEEIPPPDHVAYIQSLGGARAWEWEPDESLIRQEIVSIMDESKIIKFTKRLDSMLQTNYPFFIPQTEGDVVYEAPFGQPETMPHRQGQIQAWGNAGDTIGCGYNPDVGHVFFTKNGLFLGNAFMGIRHVWFPTVGSNGPCTITTNFGDGEDEFKYESARGYGPGGPLLISSEQRHQRHRSEGSGRNLQTEDN